MIDATPAVASAASEERVVVETGAAVGDEALSSSWALAAPALDDGDAAAAAPNAAFDSATAAAPTGEATHALLEHGALVHNLEAQSPPRLPASTAITDFEPPSRWLSVLTTSTVESFADADQLESLELDLSVRLQQSECGVERADGGDDDERAGGSSDAALETTRDTGLVRHESATALLSSPSALSSASAASSPSIESAPPSSPSSALLPHAGREAGQQAAGGRAASPARTASVENSERSPSSKPMRLASYRLTGDDALVATMPPVGCFAALFCRGPRGGR